MKARTRDRGQKRRAEFPLPLGEGQGEGVAAFPPQGPTPNTQHPTFYVLVGLPGSGKTTYARTHLPNALRISLDDLRLMLSGRAFDLRYEAAVAAAADGLRDAVAAYAAANKWEVVVDATNVTLARRAPWIATARRLGFRTVAVFVDCPPTIAHARNRSRPNPVPSFVVDGFVRRLEPPSLDEGFDEVVVVDTTLGVAPPADGPGGSPGAQADQADPGDRPVPSPGS